MMNFLNLPKVSRYTYCVCLFPYEKTTNYLKGCEKAPFQILKESFNVEPFDVFLSVNPAEKGIKTMLVNEENLKNVIKKNKEKFIVFVGGEHTITYFILKELKERFDTLLVLDAHPDVMDEYLKNKLSHATWLRRFLEEEKKEVMISGLRVMSEDEKLFLDKNKIKHSRKAIKVKNKNIYLSIDVDVLDIGLTTCSNPEPMGFSWSYLVNYLNFIFKHNNVVSADVTEHRPLKYMREKSYAIAWLVYKLFCFKEKYG
jgi:arginase family enzyme